MGLNTDRASPVWHSACLENDALREVAVILPVGKDNTWPWLREPGASLVSDLPKPKQLEHGMVRLSASRMMCSSNCCHSTADHGPLQGS